jgi:UDP-3-O-[3-hydroxymyristoyl] N-acetylglucosamine deacetylase
VGDLYVLGYPLLAKITAYRTGHALNAAFVRTVYFQNLYEIIELEEGEPLKYLENLITPFAEEQA